MWEVDRGGPECYASAMSDPAEEIRPIVELIYPLLAGHPPQTQGVVLADLLATWLAGHIVPDHPTETDEVREELLRRFLALVRELIPVNAAHFNDDEEG